VRMKIWVDADACPGVIKEILFRVAKRTGILVTLIANQKIHTPSSPFIQSVRVSSGFDIADNEIVKRVESGDLVITADLPLASEVIAKGGHALNPRGDLYTIDNIKEKVNMRDFMDTMRSSGINTGGPPPLNQRDRLNFANALDSFITRHLNR